MRLSSGRNQTGGAKHSKVLCKVAKIGKSGADPKLKYLPQVAEPL